MKKDGFVCLIALNIKQMVKFTKEMLEENNEQNKEK